MIDRISNLGYAPVAPVGSITATGAVGSSINLLTLQAQGMIGFVLEANASANASTSITSKLQSSPDNVNWTDVPGGGFAAVSDVAGAGLQTVFVDSAVIGQYVRVFDTATGSPSVARTVIAVFMVKNH